MSPTLAWSLALVLPALVLILLEPTRATWGLRYFLATAAAATVLWVARLAPPYVAALLVLLVCLTMGITPSAICLAGFASTSFFMTLSIFGLEAALLHSGLPRRACLAALHGLRRCHRRGEWVFAGGGLVLSLIVPSPHTRLATMASLLRDAMRGIPRVRVTRITAAAFIGANCFAPVFLTSGALNLLLYGMLPEQQQFGYSWVSWLRAAAVPLVVMAIGYTLVLTRIPDVADHAAPNPEAISLQRRYLGPVSSREWLVLCGVILFVMAMAGAGYHKIDHRLIGLTFLTVFLVLDLLKSGQINRDIDWGFLILLAATIGLLQAFMFLSKSHAALFESLEAIRRLIDGYHMVVIVMLAVVTIAARFWLDKAIILLAFPALILCAQGGLHPWIVVFVLLMMDSCPLPNDRDGRFHCFQSALNENGWFPSDTIRHLQRTAAPIHLSAILIAIPYWHFLGML